MVFEGANRRRRVPGLTPLIDVVFLLLIFFMLASRFDREALLPLTVRATAGVTEADAGASAGPTTLAVEIDAHGEARIEGRRVDPHELRAAAARAALEERPVRVRPHPEARLQSIVDVLGSVARAGATEVALEPLPSAQPGD